MATQPSPPRLDTLPRDLAADVLDLYRSLGGHNPRPLLRPGQWDLALDGGLLLELDVELHFNRYRRSTLERAWSKNLPWRQPYVKLCEQFEKECLSSGSWGKRWTNPSCEAMFGPGDPAGDLSQSSGAPRWKQRAIYDAMKDAYAFRDADNRVVRVSIYDEVSGATLGAVLAGIASVLPEDLLALISRRTA
jgi:hypothetical protein